jgi:hypothetical protein
MKFTYILSGFIFYQSLSIGMENTLEIFRVQVEFLKQADRRERFANERCVFLLA